MKIKSPQEKKEWIKNRIRPDEINKYLNENSDFIDDALITRLIQNTSPPDPASVRDILDKSLAIQTLTLPELATLIRVRSPDLYREMKTTAAAVKKKVYDNRIVTFAPLYLSSTCVNNCVYCGFRSSNPAQIRRILTLQEVRRETEVLAGTLGHKRLVVVYGEHPDSDEDYIEETIRAVYSVQVKTRRGTACIRRVNVNAAPMPIDELKRLHQCGLGTFQVFQETYDRRAYARVHPANTIKGNFRWRLTCMHRAQEAGIDDNGMGVLYGLADWRFELLAQLAHARELERFCGVGPHTLSFPRLEPACNTPFAQQPANLLSDDLFERVVVCARLAIPYTGLIITARESPAMRRRLAPLGVTQMDASSNVGVGAYQHLANTNSQVAERQQFVLGDPRSLDEVIREWTAHGWITSFCTAGYRCGRTGKCIMRLLRSGAEGKFCKLNAILTFKEWLDDFASPETQAVGDSLIRREIAEVRQTNPAAYPRLLDAYHQIAAGQRDIYF